MRRILLSISAVLTLGISNAQSVEQTFYVDFGENNVSSRGNLTKGADQNGHYWTNVYSSPSERLYPSDWKLVNAENRESAYTLQIGTYFHTNGMDGGGGLKNPSADLLGDLAVATATQDYMHVEGFQDYNVMRLVGLDPQKAYRFTVFGSRNAADERGGVFEFRGENYFSGYLQNAGSGLGAGGYNGNNSKPLVTEPVFPMSDGVISITINKRFKGGMVYVNCMKVEELSGLERPNKELSLAQKFFIDFGETSNDSRGHQTNGADKNGNYWNNFSSGSSGNNRIQPKTIMLRNTANAVSGIKMTSHREILTNGVNNGGYNNPTDENLGELAIKTATEDYAFIENDDKYTIDFTGLNPNRCYRFSVFGSRSTKESDRRFAEYAFSGQNDCAMGLATSGQHVGGQNVHGNVRNLAISEYIYPTADGKITFTFNRTQNPKSSFCHFNIIRIEEYQGGVRPEDPVALIAPFISGTATESGEDIALHKLKPGGQSKGVFEAYMRLRPGTLLLKGTSNGTAVTMGNDGNGRLAVDGQPFTIAEEQVARLRYDARNARLDITPVELYLKGNIVADGTKVAYKGNGVFEQQVDMNHGTVFLFSDKYFYFAFNNDDNLAVKRVSGSRTAVGMPSEGFSGENIRINRGTYTIGLDMNRLEWTVDAPIDEYKISAFGSSVCNGQGADGNKGYAYLYGQQCTARTTRGLSDYPFSVSGVSIGGNTTRNLLDRYDEMIHDFGKYVIIGLSMGNEGLHGASDKDGILAQFRDNMLKLIAQMKADGKTVVVMNNYTHGDYNSEDYSRIKSINRLIHGWDVASVNTLGAIDNGAGKWADGYMADAAHPTTDGHRQFFLAMPPSLFDALEQGKPFPVRDTEQYTTLENGSVIQFQGETEVNPFTLTVRVKGLEEGRIFSFSTTTGQTATVRLLDGGFIEYISPTGQVMKSRALATDAEAWYDITLTNYYAQKRTVVYCNNRLAGEVKGDVFAPAVFTVGDHEQALHRQFAELTFWRSAMNSIEVYDHHSGKMLKSSLDIYSPLGDAVKTSSGIANLAQSLNVAQYVQGEVTDAIGNVVASDNDVKEIYSVDGKRLSAPARGINIIGRRRVLKR